MNSENSDKLTGLDSTESLRLILEVEQGRPVTCEEAREVGESLICFFEVLADDSYAHQESILQGAS